MNLSSPNVIVFDLDGTLVDETGQMHPHDCQILRAARPDGPLLIPATGRSLHSVRRTFQHNRVLESGPLPFPLILQNGSLVLDAGEKPLIYLPFAPEVQARLEALAWSEPGCGSFFFSQGPVYLLHPTPLARQMDDRFELQSQVIAGTGELPPISKWMVIGEDRARLEALAHALTGSGPALPLEVAFSLPEVLEINPAGVNKGRALGALLEALRLDGARLYAAGDGENDLALFERAHQTFAPSSGLASVQARAGHVIERAERGILAPILDAIAQSDRP